MRFLPLFVITSLSACLPTISAPIGEEPPSEQAEPPVEARALEHDASFTKTFSQEQSITQDILNTADEERLVTVETVGTDGDNACTSGGVSLSTHISVFDVGGLRAEDFDSGVASCSKIQFMLSSGEEVTIVVEPSDQEQDGLDVIIRVDFSPEPVGCGA